VYDKPGCVRRLRDLACNRINATHLPQPGISVSAYKSSTNTLGIVATNYNSSAISQRFSMSNAPAFSAVTPYTTSATLGLAQQSPVTVTSNAFNYDLPAQSITTFVGTP
jgi:O-glycosyl hydrolase